MKRMLSVAGVLIAAAGIQAAGLDEVNTKIGTISHMLVPVFPIVQRPNSMMRMIPANESAKSDTADGFGLVVPAHRHGFAFKMSPLGAEDSNGVFHYDHSCALPYRYSVFVEEAEAMVEFAPGERAAVFSIIFEGNAPRRILLEPRRKGGKLTYDAKSGAISGFENYRFDTKAYLFMESDVKAVSAKVTDDAEKPGVILEFPANTKQVKLRYAISYIDIEQATQNLRRELKDYDLDRLARETKVLWDKTLGQVKVEGGTADERAVFYSSLYRCHERMINFSEDGRYHGGYDKKTYNDDGVPFWTDDWIWDTFHAFHPLMCILHPKQQGEKLTSYIRMAEQNGGVYPTFPEIFGDAHCMNGQHAFSIFLDAHRKGITGFDFEKATDYMVSSAKKGSFLPWYRGGATDLDKFFFEHGYYPGLHPGEKETVVPELARAEKRQCVAVTLAAAYDVWCIAESAKELGRKEDEAFFRKHSFNYRNLWKSDTGFFHPKDSEGKWIEPFDYKYSGGQGARDYYDENNGWIYNWEVYHNIPDLVNLFGGADKMAAKLDRMYSEPMERAPWEFYGVLPDSTGLIGMYSMANEPCLHIPYLYNYVGQPWKTQKRVRTLLDLWWRNDYMGLCGDEDGGGLSAFAIFSMMGFYPVTPGLPTYTLTSPVFKKTSIALENGKTFTILAPKASPANKYIQSVKINGKDWNSTEFSHDVITNGGTIEVDLGPRPNKAWGVGTK